MTGVTNSPIIPATFELPTRGSAVADGSPLSDVEANVVQDNRVASDATSGECMRSSSGCSKSMCCLAKCAAPPAAFMGAVLTAYAVGGEIAAMVTALFGFFIVMGVVVGQAMTTNP